VDGGELLLGLAEVAGTIAVNAADREAHMREVAHSAAENLPQNTYGRLNRQEIAAREMRIATRLRAVERAYGALDRDAIQIRPAEPPVSLDKAPDRELELE
jgi:hypothetical protein